VKTCKCVRGKMQKALENGRLSGVFPRAQSLIIQVIANDHVKALAPGKLCQLACSFSDVVQAFADCVSITSVILKTCQEHC